MVSEILSKFGKIPSNLKDISQLRRVLQETQPDLFERSMLFGDGQELPLGEMNSGDNEELPDPSVVYDSIKNSLEQSKELIDGIRKRIELISSHNNSKFSFRIKSFKSFSENFSNISPKRSLIDVIGIRIVPTESQTLKEIMLEFEKAFADEVAFKLNTIAFSNQEIVNKIGEDSIYYRALHYYIPVDNFFIEVQIRTPSVDQWSNIHHDTVYKPKIPISESEKRQIMEFGMISNIVDYFDLIKDEQ